MFIVLQKWKVYIYLTCVLPQLDLNCQQFWGVQLANSAIDNDDGLVFTAIQILDVLKNKIK